MEPPAKRLRLSADSENKLEPSLKNGTSPATLVGEGDDPGSTTNNGMGKWDPPITAERALKMVANQNKRASVLNLRNYPDNHHSVGIGIWVAQKIDQSRRGDDPIDSNTSPNGFKPQIYLNNGSRRAGEIQSETLIRPTTIRVYTDPIDRPAGSSLAESAQADPHTSRLQRQRNRKTKQRSENWVKNKENDIVARAKLEARKQPPSDEERQSYVANKTKDDFERLLSRLAASLNPDLVGLGPFQRGFGNHFFSASNLHDKYDLGDSYKLPDETLQAGKILVDVLPSVVETPTSLESKIATDLLILSLERKQPSPEAFFAAMDLLAQDTAVTTGIDIIKDRIGLQKYNPARPENGQFSPSQSYISGIATTSPNMATAQGPRIWQWKEPATPLTSAQPSTVKTNHPRGSSAYQISPRLPETSPISEASACPTPGMEMRSEFYSQDLQEFEDSQELQGEMAPVVDEISGRRSSGRDRKPTSRAVAFNMEPFFSRKPSLPTLMPKPSRDWSIDKIAQSASSSESTTRCEDSVSTASSSFTSDIVLSAWPTLTAEPVQQRSQSTKPTQSVMSIDTLLVHTSTVSSPEPAVSKQGQPRTSERVEKSQSLAQREIPEKRNSKMSMDASRLIMLAEIAAAWESDFETDDESESEMDATTERMFRERLSSAMAEHAKKSELQKAPADVSSSIEQSPTGASLPPMEPNSSRKVDSSKEFLNGFSRETIVDTADLDLNMVPMIQVHAPPLSATNTPSPAPIPSRRKRPEWRVSYERPMKSATPPGGGIVINEKEHKEAMRMKRNKLRHQTSSTSSPGEEVGAGLPGNSQPQAQRTQFKRGGQLMTFDGN